MNCAAGVGLHVGMTTSVSGSLMLFGAQYAITDAAGIDSAGEYISYSYQRREFWLARRRHNVESQYTSSRVGQATVKEKT